MFLTRVTIAAVVSLVCLCAAAWGQTPMPVENPDKFSEEIMRMIYENAVAAVGKAVAETVGQPSLATNIEGSLRVLGDKRFDFTSKVIDNEYGNALRQIVYYAYVENVGFVYFRFNFKRTSRGWIMANFNFKSETNELFPKDFVDR